jgi:hypothetical protein
MSLGFPDASTLSPALDLLFQNALPLIVAFHFTGSVAKETKYGFFSLCYLQSLTGFEPLSLSSSSPLPESC